MAAGRIIRDTPKCRRLSRATFAVGLSAPALLAALSIALISAGNEAEQVDSAIEAA